MIDLTEIFSKWWASSSSYRFFCHHNLYRIQLNKSKNLFHFREQCIKVRICVYPSPFPSSILVFLVIYVFAEDCCQFWLLARVVAVIVDLNDCWSSLSQIECPPFSIVQNVGPLVCLFHFFLVGYSSSIWGAIAAVVVFDVSKAFSKDFALSRAPGLVSKG